MRETSLMGWAQSAIVLNGCEKRLNLRFYSTMVY